MNFKQFREIFTFTQKERNGLLVLVFILFLTICLDIFLPYLIPVKEYDVSKWKEETDRYYAVEPAKADTIKENPGTDNIRVDVDPNRADLAELKKIGVPAGIAANWIRYLQKGGRFKKKEEVMKLYGMTTVHYRRLEKFLVMPESNGDWKANVGYAKSDTKKVQDFERRDTMPVNHYPVKRPKSVIALNEADSAQLEALPGIGPVLASRIIKYRRLLGGFYEVAQLKDIYGMTDELWMKCSPWLLADSTGMKKLEINFLSVNELGHHPYIGFNHAKRMVKQRDSKGKFTGKEDLAFCFSADSLHRLLPYLSLGSK